MIGQFDASTLNWIKGELDETLKEARLALEKYVDTPDDETQLHFCATYLHQVAGTLQMVELFGAGQLAAEMERLADALPGIEARESALEVLMRAILLLPDYLELLQGGQADSPLILLPLLNELRRARGEAELQPSALFQPNLDIEPGPDELPVTGGDPAIVAAKLRPYYQAALLNLFKGKEPANSIKTMATVIAKLGGACTERLARQCCWAGLGVLEALMDDGLQLQGGTKQLLGKYEQFLRQLSVGESALDIEAVTALVNASLLQVAEAGSSGPRVSALRLAFQLESLMPNADALEQIRAGLGGFNAELKRTVSRDVMEDLSRVKDVLDLFGRGNRPVIELEPVADALTHTADVLALLRQMSLAERLRERAGEVKNAVHAGSEPSAELLMAVAESVLNVETALSNWETGTPAIQDDDSGPANVAAEADVEHRRVVRQVMKEAKDDLVKIREAINGFLVKPDERTILADVPRLLHQLIGSLDMLSYRRVAQVLRACRLFIERELAGGSSLPGSARLDALADAVMSVEYYLEAFVESRVHPTSVLEVAERAVAQFGYPVDALPGDEPSAAEADDLDGDEGLEVEAGGEELELSVAEESLQADTEAVESAGNAEAPAKEPERAPASIPLSAEVDEEIIGIFVEEAGEELANIGQLLPRWIQDTNDENALRDLRRSFHTLKGSGRLVGARDLGEFAWAFEDLLNKVIDKAIPAGPELFELIQQAHAALPELLEQFTSGKAPASDVATLSAMAEKLAQPSSKTATTPTVPVEADEGETGSSPGEALIADPVLRDIYLKEAEGHVATLHAFLGDCVRSCRVSNELIRALHTLCGSSRTAGVSPLAELAGVMEKVAKAIQAANGHLEQPGLDVLQATARYAEDVLSVLRGERTSLPELADLMQEAQGLLETTESVGLGAAPLAEFPLEPEFAPDFPEAGLAERPLLTDELELAAAFEEPGLGAAVADSSEEEGEPIELLEPFDGALPDSATEFDVGGWGEEPDEADGALASPELPGDFAIDEMVELASDTDTGLEFSDDASIAFSEGLADMESESIELASLGELEEFFPEEASDQPQHSPAEFVPESVTAPSELSEMALDELALSEPLWAEEELVESLLRDEPVATAADSVETADIIEIEEETSAPLAEPGADNGSGDELMEIFINEANDLIGGSEDLLQGWVARSEDLRPLETLQRVLHTLKGGARWAGVTAISELGHALESTLAAVVEGRVETTDELRHLIQRAYDHLAALVAQLREGESLGTVDEIVQSLGEATRSAPSVAATAEASKAPVASLEYDPELLSIFLEEGFEIINASDDVLHAWAQHPADRNLVENLQRQLHTLKGGARMAGVAEIGDLGHCVESMLAGVADGILQASPAMHSLVQRAHDRLAVMLEQLRNHAPLPSGKDLIGDIEALVSGRPATALTSDEKESAGSVPAPLQEGPVVPAEPQEVAAAAAHAHESHVDQDEDARDRRVSNRPQHELVRVRSDLLDNMVNVAGEASIFRSRIEQQVGNLRFNLEELEQIVDRLRDKLRLVDIETEAQIQSRYVEAGQNYEEFDPLEFDRFTHMQQLSRSMMESLGDLSSIGTSLHNVMRETETLLVQQARVNTELQEGLMHTRMVPLVQNAPRLRRIVRQTCDEMGKEAELRFKGAEVEMDRHVVDRIMAPLEHLLRNAVAHGIEPPNVRESHGKPRVGSIVVHQYREGAEVVVKVTDNGAGIDVEAVRAKAIQRGLLLPGRKVSDQEVIPFILESGFSTAQSLTQISGRGVGMDVVNNEVRSLNGSLSIESEPGQGTTFVIRLPLTLTVSRALLVYGGEEVYAVPLLSIEGIVRVAATEVKDLLTHKEPRYRWLGQDYDVLHLATVLGARGVADSEARMQSLLLAHSGEHRMALVVDGLIGSREIVVKPLGRQLSSLRGLSGATILGDGRVALILELPALIRMGLSRRDVGDSATIEDAKVVRATKPVVMVVDDSITVRKVTSRLLERNDIVAVTAKDGVEALAQLEDALPDVMLLDIEMPRMDGYELATHIRNSQRLKDIPIIMITSRSGEKHRQRAFQIGVNVYMSKPFQETELLDNIHSLLAERGKMFVIR